LIKNVFVCHLCGFRCRLIRHRQLSDGFLWRCAICRSTASVRTGSIFATSTLPIQKQVMLLYEWSYDTPLTHCEREYNVSHKAGCAFYCKCRRLCTEHFNRHPIVLGGTHRRNGRLQRKVVEVDESYFSRSKYRRGRAVPGIWVFGVVERQSGRCCLTIVRRRTRRVLHGLIQQQVAAHTCIVSDLWRGYTGLDRLPQGYRHRTINHSQHFVNPNNRSIHTNNIENVWSKIKRKHKYISGKRHTSVRNVQFHYRLRMSVGHIPPDNNPTGHKPQDRINSTLRQIPHHCRLNHKTQFETNTRNNSAIFCSRPT